jgi:hypothetical protein
MKVFGVINRLKKDVARIVGEGLFLPTRVNQYKELIVKQSDPTLHAEEGSYFSLLSAVGTATALLPAIPAALTLTAPFLTIRNTESAGGKNIILKKFRLLCSVAGVPTTNAIKFTWVVDSTNRVTSGGSAITPVNVRPDVSTASIASVLIASTVAIVASAAGGTAQTIARTSLTSQNRNALATIAILFSMLSKLWNNTMDSTGVGTNFMIWKSRPVIIPPGGTFLMYVDGNTFSTQPTYEYSIQWVER